MSSSRRLGGRGFCGRLSDLRPNCLCHDVPMWRSHGGRYWQCAIKTSKRNAIDRVKPAARESAKKRQRAWAEADRNDRRMLVSLYNRHGCSECKRDQSFRPYGGKYVLHRHHVNPETKRFGIGAAIDGRPKWTDGIRRRVNFATFAEELNRTVALCDYCHFAAHGRKMRASIVC